MNERKIVSLLQSEAFLAKFNDAETVAETKKLFASEGLELNDEKAQTIMDALESANKKAHDGEVMSEKDLELVSGGGLIKKSLEFIILSALIVEGTRIGIKIKKRGELREGVKNLVEKGKSGINKAEDTIVEWLTDPPKK